MGNPLNIPDDVWNELVIKQRNRLRILEGWDLSFLVGDWMKRQGVNIQDTAIHEEALLELKKFFAIKIVHSPNPMGMFGQVIAAAWRSFVLFTEHYGHFCMCVNGDLINHVPGGGSNASNKNWIEIYHKWFGEFPLVWSMDLDGNTASSLMEQMNKRFELVAERMDSDNGAYGCGRGSQ